MPIFNDNFKLIFKIKADKFKDQEKIWNSLKH